MKKHNMMRVASALAVVTLLSTSLISGTLAKYVSTFEKSSTAQVAKWAFNVSEKDKTETKAFTFDLFKNITDLDGQKEDDVKGDYVIAPGTAGQITLTLKNESDVTASYQIVFTENSRNLPGGVSRIPLKYAIIKGDGTPDEDTDDWTTSIENLKQGTTSKIKLPANSTDEQADTYTVYWKWDYKGNDATDTSLGTAAADPVAIPQVTVTATITATQED